MTLRVLSALLLLSACTGDPKPADDSGSVTLPVDADGDGFDVNSDCNDDDLAINPDAVEACDAIDNDCDGGVDEDAADESTWYGDADGDGYGGTLSVAACSAPTGFVAGDGDCNDADAEAYPGAEEDCSDTADKNCDGSVGYADADADGVPACEDCDDGDATALPGGVEACDGVDNDCNGTPDDSTADLDGDGTLACADCDDTDASAYPGAPEACDGDDEDCDGEVDEAGASGEATWYADTDGDGYGNASMTATACNVMLGYVADATDCDDAAGDVNPGADEVCGTLGVDEDCDGAVDDADGSLDTATGSTFYLDYDADGYGGSTIWTQACVLPANYASNAADCDDTDAATNPDGTEVCDAADADEDCDGLSDDADTASGQFSFYTDLDMDGFGDADAVVMACDTPAGAVENDEDCDDGDDAVNPDATEVCDAADVDEDCDGAADDLDIALGEGSFYYDADGDAYGNAAIGSSACDATGTWVGDATDCDDGDAGDHPGAAEQVGNEDDEDCDGGEQCYVDGDDDGYLSSAPSVATSADVDCDDAMEGSSTTPSGDCDDAVATSSPVGTESCNLADDDCDGTVDDGVGDTYYLDADVDGYGVPTTTTVACTLPTGYATTSDDCDDSTALANPGATEVCGDTYDNDCDADSSDCSFDGSYAASTYDVRITGGTSSDYLGKGVAVGDFDGDGDGDLAGGMPNADVPSSSAGSVLLHYGPVITSGLATTVANATLTGTTSSQYVGTYLAAGDHDGDGADDLVIGGYGASSSAGAAYIVYGDATRRSGTTTVAAALDVATITGGTSSDYLGWNLGAGGDMDGDGTDEVVLGAYGQDSGGSSAGAAYLFYGSSTRRSGSAAASTAAATILGGTSSDTLGYAVAFVDDMDGDGLDELLVGAYGQDTAGSSAGAAYLFLGSDTALAGTMSASSADLTYYGSAASDYLGYGVYNLTDITGDGYADAGVHGYGYDGGGLSGSGGLFVYGGGTSLSSTAVATLYGSVASDSFGEEACSVGDQDGDGVNDLLVGAYSQDTAYSSAGAAYLFHAPVTGTISASTADAMFYGGTTGDGYFGRRLPDDPADVTGDGVPDVIATAYWDDSYVYDGGALYVWAGLGGE